MDARIIYETRRLIKKNLLGRALAEIEQLRDFMTYAPLFERVSKIQNDYELMVDYWKKGYFP